MNPNEMPGTTNGASVNAGNPNTSDVQSPKAYEDMTVAELIDRLRSAEARAERISDELREEAEVSGRLAAKLRTMTDQVKFLTQQRAEATRRTFEAADELSQRGKLLTVAGAEIKRTRRAAALMAEAIAELTDDDAVAHEMGAD